MEEQVVPTREGGAAIAKIEGERDASLQALRKFREESPPRENYEPWYSTMDDPQSLSIFGELKVGMNQWSVREAKDPSQLNDLQGSDRECFFKEVAKIVLLDGVDKQEFPTGLRGRPRVLIIVLEALLTHHMFTTVYPDPFFFLDTLKLIHPSRKSPDEVMIRSQTEKLLRKAAISGASNFMRSPAKYIINGHPDALQQLEDLYMLAAKHSYMIWKKDSIIKLLDASNFLGQPFDLQNPNMAADNRVFQNVDISPNGQQITMVSSPAILRYGLRGADPAYYEKRWWHEVSAYRHAGVSFYIPRPGDADQGSEPMTLPPRPSGDLKPAILPSRSDLSAEALCERTLKRFDRVTLLDLVKPYLDDFAEQLRPVLEGLRGELAQRIEERDEMEKERDEFRSKHREALQSIERLKSGM